MLLNLKVPVCLLLTANKLVFIIIRSTIVLYTTKIVLYLQHQLISSVRDLGSIAMKTEKQLNRDIFPKTQQDARPLVDRGMFDQIMSAHIVFHKYFFSSLQGTGLTPGQPKLLEFLKDNGPVMQKELAKACSIEPSTIARLLPKMEDSGLILRRAMAGDRRAISVSLTHRGEHQASFVKEVFKQCEAKAFCDVPVEKQAHLLEVFEKIEGNLQHGTKQEARVREDGTPKGTVKPNQSLQYHLMACQGLLQKQLFSRLTDTGLTPGQPKILEFLEHGEGCQQKEIAAACKIEPATVTSLLLNMETSGLIQRKMKEGNRRSLHVYLTERGRAMMERTLLGLEETIAQAFSGILQEQQELKESLKLVRCNLTKF